MSSISTAVPHRQGRRVHFIPPLGGAPAKWTIVLDNVSDTQEMRRIASTATATLRRWSPETLKAQVETAQVSDLSAVTPDQLMEVRRPASHKGMKNYISRVRVPSEAHEVRGVWCESFNELAHMRDLLITRDLLQVSTQPLRIEWLFAEGTRWHVPDFVCRERGGATVLVDVTTKRVLQDPRKHAIFAITAATAAAIGWKYEVRTELPAQRARNLGFIHAARHVVGEDFEPALRRLRHHPLRLDVLGAAQLLASPGGDHQLVWQLVAAGKLHIDLDRPIEHDTLVSTRPFTAEVKPWLHTM